MKKVLIVYLTVGAFIINAQEIIAENYPISISANYRNLLINSKTQDDDKKYYVDSNRFRLEVKGKPTSSFSYNIQYDNHLVFGNYLATKEFLAIEASSANLPRSTYWDMEDEISKKSELSWFHGIYRGYVTIRYDEVDLTLGRQRIPWGKGWFWSPLDMFNPISPTAIERDERQGVDGALVTISGGTVQSLSLLYLPQHDYSDSVASRIVWPVYSYDIALSVGRHLERGFAGVDFAGYVGDGGFYGELVSIENEKGRDKINLLLSGNYNFESSLYIMLEYFHNGNSNLPASGIKYRGRDYIGFQGSYDLSPLTRWNNYLIVNIDDRSWFFSPSIYWSLREDIDLNLGIQVFGGDGGDEYGGIKDIYFSEFKWFF